MKPVRSIPDWILEAIALVALTGALALAVLFWDDLASGAPRRLLRPTFYTYYTVKNALWLVMGLNGLAYLGLSAATQYPGILSLPIEVQRDLPHAPQLLFRMVIVFKAVLMLFGAYLIWSLVQLGLGRPAGVTLRFVLAFLLCVPAPLIFYTIKLRKYER